MTQPSYARLLLEHWGVTVTNIPTSDRKQKQEADFLAYFDNVRVIIEEKTKEDGADYLATRFKELKEGGFRTESIPLVRNETVSGVIRDAAHQLQSSSDIFHDFRLIWFTATGANAQAKYEQFIATLYGCTNIVEQNAASYKRCYYFMNSDFYRRATVVDAAIAAYLHKGTISAKLCLNSLSPRYEELRRSTLLSYFDKALQDPVDDENNGTAFILDCALCRKDEGPLIAYLQSKYKTRPLMTLNLGYMSTSRLF